MSAKQSPHIGRYLGNCSLAVFRPEAVGPVALRLMIHRLSVRSRPGSSNCGKCQRSGLHWLWLDRCQQPKPLNYSRKESRGLGIIVVADHWKRWRCGAGGQTQMDGKKVFFHGASFNILSDE